MDLDELKAVAIEIAEKPEEKQKEKIELLKFFLKEMDSYKDVYNYLEYIGCSERYENIIIKYDFKPYCPNRSEILAYNLNKEDFKFKPIEKARSYFEEKKFITLVNINDFFEDDSDTRKAFPYSTVEIRYNKTYVTITNPYDGKYLGDNYFQDHITVDKKIIYSGNMTEKILEFITNKYKK